MQPVIEGVTRTDQYFLEDNKWFFNDHQSEVFIKSVWWQVS